MFLQLGFKTLKQGESIGRGTGKTSQHLAMVELAYFARRAFDNDVAQGHLAIAANGHLHALGGLAAHADDGRAVKLFHVGHVKDQLVRNTTCAYSLMPITLKNTATKRGTSRNSIWQSLDCRALIQFKMLPAAEKSTRINRAQEITSRLAPFNPASNWL